MADEENQDFLIIPTSPIKSSGADNLNQKQNSNIETNQAKTITRSLRNNNKNYMVMKNTKNVSIVIFG